MQFHDILDFYESPDPMTIIGLVAKHNKLKLKDATIILVVDGMQNLITSYEDGLNADSLFYKTLINIGNLGQKGAFLLPCCTATVSRPIEQSLKPSNRRRIYLPVTPLEPPTLNENGIIQSAFQMDEIIMKILVGDCGGHGRALEILWNLTKDLNITKCDVGGLMRMLRSNLAEIYKSALPNETDALAIVRAVLAHHRLADDKYIPNTKKFPDQVVAPGLIRYEQTQDGFGYLHVPYIWLWMMAERTSGEVLLPGWQFDDYNALLAKEDQTLPPHCSWEDFEKFNARYRCIKSFAQEDGKLTKISNIHYGARLEGDIIFVNHHLDVIASMNQIKTNTSKENSVNWIVKLNEENSINMREYKHVAINAKSAESGDTVLSLDTSPPANEIQQYKLFTNSTVQQKNFDEELKKAASDKDFFILFTTQEKECKIKLSNNSGIVDRSNWLKYFGPFSGRAFAYGVEDTLNINKSSFTTLQLVNGVGPTIFEC
ncbi:hypothetical protein BC937DRAFT_94287 [Endogone sp. FLAS-F59071]|nr:hypothetical protein BC937DRAFT_94287 [Endogone sp. FLAS-F59071]|eukprot:RUS14132.1 hypothetical protein BC937DRAFT_94287 [Endogone sp. FLAS-F59071]